MTVREAITWPTIQADDGYRWVGRIIDQFSRMEHAVGKLALAIDISTERSPVCCLDELRDRLRKTGSNKDKALEEKLKIWLELRAYRNLLAHSTMTTLYDTEGRVFWVSHHLPMDTNNILTDRLWTADEQDELLQKVKRNNQSVGQQIANLLADQQRLQVLREAS